MSKVLIDRELAERAVYSLELAYETDTPTVRDICAVLATPSGTPAMPVKAYYHESPNEYGGLNKSVGLEVRKAFIDAPLVLESDAMECIACLEGEIAKRDARIVELENELSDIDFARRVSLQNESDLAETLNLLRAKLAALKAQEPVAEIALSDDGYKIGLLGALRNHRLPIGTKLYAAPVSEAKAQGDYAPDSVVWIDAHHVIEGNNPSFIKDVALVSAERTSETQIPLVRLNAAPVQQVSVPDERIIPTSAELIQWALEEEPEETRFQEGYNAAKRWVKMQIEAGIAAPAAPAADAGCVLEQAMYTLISIGYHENSGLVHELRQALAAHSAEGVV